MFNWLIKNALCTLSVCVSFTSCQEYKHYILANKATTTLRTRESTWANCASVPDYRTLTGYVIMQVYQLRDYIFRTSYKGLLLHKSQDWSTKMNSPCLTMKSFGIHYTVIWQRLSILYYLYSTNTNKYVMCYICLITT